MRNVIVLDIDGCLISENGNVDDNYYKSLSWLAGYIRRANVAECPNICLCSGRSAVFTEAISYLIGWPNFTTIAESGAVFFDPLLREHRINPAITAQTLKALNLIKMKILPDILRAYPGLFLAEGNQINIPLIQKNAGSRLAATSIRKGIWKLISLFVRKKIESQLTIEQARKKIRRTFARLIRKELVKTVIFRNSITVAPAEVNKGAALEILAKEKDIDLKQSLGIGDSKLDISFLLKTGLVGCPQNADDVCKKLVKEKNGKISSFSYAEGVVDVIKWFTQIE